MGFWLVATALALVVSGFMALALLRSRQSSNLDPNQDMRIYREQLAEIDRDVGRGVLAREESEQVRMEVSRRLLAADRMVQTANSVSRSQRGSPVIAVVLCLTVTCGAIGLYLSIGAPGYPDLPLADRLQLSEEIRGTRTGQVDAEALAGAASKVSGDIDPTLSGLMERLRAAVAEHPDSLEGLSLLARYEARLGNHIAAHSAQLRLIALKGDTVVAEDYAALAEQMVLAAGGFVSPEAESALTKALQLDPEHGPARYYMGLMHAQSGRPDLAFGIWRGLLETSPQDAPWIPPIEALIGDVARAAGLSYIAPAPARDAPGGPTVDDINAANEIGAAEKAEMIHGMVEGLAERIDSGENASPAEWARLIRSLGVLGDRERAFEFWSKAQERFADDPAAAAMIRDEATRLGVVK